jgi:hypothetical protein
MSLSSEARAAKALGLTRFTPSPTFICKLHKGEHSTTNRRCCECHRLAKDPAKQAAYWAAKGSKYNLAKKAKYYAVKENQHGS